MMRLLWSAAFVLLAALAAVPTAEAQLPFQGVTVAASELATPIPYSGSTQLPVTVTIGCLTLASELSTTATVTIPEPPAWLTVTPADLDLSGDIPMCVTGAAGTIVKEAMIGLAVAPEAPGVVKTEVNVVATVGATSGTGTASFAVAYHASHKITPDVKFPVQVTGPTFTFNVTAEQNANARSMIMFEQFKVTAGSFSGLASQPYNPPESKVFKVKFTAPPGEWNESKVTFYNYSHYLLTTGEAGDPELEARPEWTFVNAAPPAPDGDDKGAPGAAGPLTALLLVACAFVAARRRA